MTFEAMSGGRHGLETSSKLLVQGRCKAYLTAGLSDLGTAAGSAGVGTGVGSGATVLVLGVAASFSNFARRVPSPHRVPVAITIMVEMTIMVKRVGLSTKNNGQLGLIKPSTKNNMVNIPRLIAASIIGSPLQIFG